MGDTWTHTGDLLNVSGGQALVAKFTLAEIVDVDGDPCARITGEVTGGWEKTPGPKVTFETCFSLARKVPVRGSLAYESKRRTARIEVALVPEPSPAPPAPAGAGTPGAAGR